MRLIITFCVVRWRIQQLQMEDNRDRPKDTVSESQSCISTLNSSSHRNAKTLKSPSSRSTIAEGQQVMLGNLIEGCNKGSYVNREGKAQEAEAAANKINNIAEALQDSARARTPGRRNRKWTQKQVKRLHRCVEIFGTDFSLIERMFPDRKRSELMNKFKKQGKKNLLDVKKTLTKHEDMRLSKHLRRKNSLRKESLVSVNSLDSADINLVNQVIKLVQKDQQSIN